jgi:glycosyltransferase involved in cell wall biosynthesis
VYNTFPLIRRGLLKIRAIRPKLLKASIAFGLPLVLQELFGIVLDSGDRVVVRHYLGADALGFYSVAYGMSTYVSNFLIAPLGLAITPIYIRLWNEQGPAKTSEFLSSTFDLFLMIAAAVMAVVWVSSHDILLVLASPKYQGADRLMPAIIAGLLIYTAQIFTNAGLIIHKRTALLAGAIAISAALNIGLNILLVPRMGLRGAALVTFWSYGFCSLLIGVLSSRFLSLKVHLFRAIRYLVAATAAVLLAAGSEMRNPAANAVARTAAALVAYIAILFIVDPRVRTWAKMLCRRLNTRHGDGSVADSASSDPINPLANLNSRVRRDGHHILFIFDQLNNLSGGAERSLLKLIRSLPRDRFRISVATFCAPSDRSVLTPLNCPVQFLPMSKCMSAQGVKVALEIRRIIREEHVSIVQTFFPSSDLWGSVIARLSGCSIIISSRRDMGFQLTLKQKVAYRLLSPVFARVHTVSDAVRQFTIREDRIDPRKVITIPNGVRIPPPITPVERDLVRMRYRISPEATLVVDVGNIRPVRGFDVLVRAAAIVCRAHPNTMFLIVGQTKDTEYSCQIRDLAASLGVAENVCFAGGESDPIQILLAADLFCHLSYTDGLSNALLEAMSAGLPSVITDAGGNPEVVKEGWNGFVVQPADHQTAAERIRLLLDNPEMARRMGEHGRQMIEERFTERHMAEAFIAIYDELLRSKLASSS